VHVTYNGYRVPRLRYGALVAWHFISPLMNSLNKNKVAFFSIKAMDFPIFGSTVELSSNTLFCPITDILLWFSVVL